MTASSNEQRTGKVQTLADVLRDVSEFRWQHSLYLPGRGPWDEESVCAVLDPEDSDDPDEEPEEAQRLGLICALSVQITQSIVENAREQKPDVTLKDVTAAFNFYFDNDAYILFDAAQF